MLFASRLLSLNITAFASEDELLVMDVEIDEDAADVNGDGEITRAELLRLAKYFSGFDVELGK